MPSCDKFLVIALGNPSVRRKLHEDLRTKGAQFTNVIHPTVIVAEGTRLGVGVVLALFSIISANSYIGDGVVINCFAVIQHDAQVCNFCLRYSFVNL